jgi:hypothetical protein
MVYKAMSHVMLPHMHELSSAPTLVASVVASQQTAKKTLLPTIRLLLSMYLLPGNAFTEPLLSNLEATTPEINVGYFPNSPHSLVDWYHVLEEGILSGSLFYLEGVSSIGTHLPAYTVSHSRRPQSFHSPQIPHSTI